MEDLKTLENNAVKILKIIFQKRGYTDIRLEDNLMFGYDDEKNLVMCNLEMIKKLDKENTKFHISSANEFKTNHIILFYLTATPSAFKVCSSSNDITVELFEVSELQIDITEHYLQPKFEILSKNEDKDLRVTYGFNKEILPVILKTDPISRFYNFPRDRIIKIIGKNNIVRYRIVR
jgi:DNA-directed RNA polymerase subunit H (RpoH/RPB5)